MASVNQTRPHCVNQMEKTHSKPLAARHGRGTARYVWIGLYSVGYTVHYTLGSLRYKHLANDFIKFSIKNDHSTLVAFIDALPQPHAAKPLERTLKWPNCRTLTHV